MLGCLQLLFQKEIMITGLTPLVTMYLMHYPETRDDDRALVSMMWENQGFNLRGYKKGEFFNHNTITRARRKIQEKNAWLRGKTWKKRHTKSKKIRQEIIDF